MITFQNINPVIKRIEIWTDSHHPKLIDYFRILLGMVLLAKGIFYVMNNKEVMEMIGRQEYWVLHYAIAHYVIGGSIVCGILIITGLFFRIAILFEIPALLGSIVYIDLHRNFFAINSGLAYSIITLTMLVFFFIYGPGKISADYYLQTHKDKNFDVS